MPPFATSRLVILLLLALLGLGPGRLGRGGAPGLLERAPAEQAHGLCHRRRPTPPRRASCPARRASPVFDVDGTLIVERPLFFVVEVALARLKAVCPDYGNKGPEQRGPVRGPPMVGTASTC